MSQQGRRR